MSQRKSPRVSSRWTSSRRRFLQAAGLMGASTMLPSLARAQSSAPPKRLVVLFGGAGFDPHSLRMRPPGADPSWSAYDLYDPANGVVPDDLEFEFDLGPLAENDFSSTLRPLHRHRNKMIVTEGLSYWSSRYEDGDAHASGHLACLTGAYGEYVFDGVKCHASHPSIDQLIADHIKQEVPLHEPLAFGLPLYGGRHVVSPFHEAFYRWSSSAQTSVDRVPFEADPEAAFTRIFEGVLAAGSDPTPRDLAQTDIFNRVSEHYAQLLPRLSTADRNRLDAHRTLLTQLQQNLAQAPVVGCNMPSAPGGIVQPFNDLFVQDLRSWFDLTAAAFSCDLTRVVAIRDMSWTPNTLIDPNIDDSVDWHHDYEHHAGPEQRFAESLDPDYVEAVRATALQDALQASWVAELCDRLDAIPESDGSTMLDNTLVLWVRELSHGNHGHEHYHTVMLGNVGGDGNGHFNTGRYIKYAQNLPNPWHRNYRNEFTGTPYSHYLISILQAFGMTQNALGGITSRDGSAPHANASATVDLTGPLPRLR